MRFFSFWVNAKTQFARAGMSLFPSLHAGEAAHASYDAIAQGYDGETFLVSDQSRVHLLFNSCLMVQDLATQQLLEKNIPFLLVPSFVSLGS